jgi:hypothetical protein
VLLLPPPRRGTCEEVVVNELRPVVELGTENTEAVGERGKGSIPLSHPTPPVSVSPMMREEEPKSGMGSGGSWVGRFEWAVIVMVGSSSLRAVTYP